MSEDGSMQIREGATPIVHDGSNVGVLVVHGFTGSPVSIAPLAHHLAAAGYTVRAPRLPGHGTSHHDLNRTTWHDWYSEVATTYDELAERCDTVVACGTSMGGTLATLLVQRHPEIAGLALINPAFEMRSLKLRTASLLRRVVPSVRGIGTDIKKPGALEFAYDRVPLRALESQQQLSRQVTRDLPQITQPVLLMHSRIDHVVSPECSQLFLSRISSKDVTDVRLENSYHVATLDHDAPLVQQLVTDFVSRVGGQA